MRVTTFSDYALRVLMYLAVQADRRATVDEIAAAYGISSNHLTKVVHLLGRAGWVQTVRGKGGGLRLGQPAESIRLGEVVRLCEGSAAYVECMVVDLSHHCRIAPACKLSGILSGAFGENAIAERLRKALAGDVDACLDETARTLSASHEATAVEQGCIKPIKAAAAALRSKE